jgi:hypothetical protein
MLSSREAEGFWGDSTLAGIVKALLALITTLVLVGIAYISVAVLISATWYCGDRFLLGRSRNCTVRKIGTDGEVFEDFSEVNRADFVGVLTWMGYTVYGVCGLFLVGLVIMAITQMKWW